MRVFKNLFKRKPKLGSIENPHAFSIPTFYSQNNGVLSDPDEWVISDVKSQIKNKIDIGELKINNNQYIKVPIKFKLESLAGARYSIEEKFYFSDGVIYSLLYDRKSFDRNVLIKSILN